jgi:hypothetical protein
VSSSRLSGCRVGHRLRAPCPSQWQLRQQNSHA